MNPARKSFLSHITPRLEALGYEWKPSKNAFVQSKDSLLYSIELSWDGRGGITYLNRVNSKISIPAIARASKKLLPYVLDASIYDRPPVCQKPFPQMYSKTLIDLANQMKFKEMAALSLEEKYPNTHIIRTVESVYQYIINFSIPFHQSIHTESDVLSQYLLLGKKQYESGDFTNVSFYILTIILLSKKLEKAPPDWVKNFQLFRLPTLDPHWNQQGLNVQELQKRLEILTF